MMRVSLILFMLSFSGQLLLAQSLVLTVRDSTDQKPIKGVLVRLDDVLLPRTTDDRGEIVLKPLKNRVLLSFRMMGYQRKELDVLAGKLPAVVYLSRTRHTLAEVTVNTGYQVLSRERSAGSFELVDSALFNRSMGMNLLSRLENTTSGLLFDTRADQPKLQIRGLSTLFSDANPLIILDDFPFEGNIESINPNDIANVSILKDATATSIWGARAGNGVIVITSKRGSSNKARHISYRNNFSWSAKPNLMAYPEMSSADYIGFQRVLYDQGYYESRINDKTLYPVLGEAVEIWQGVKEGRMDAAEGDRLVDLLKTRDVRQDISRYLYRPTFLQQHFVSIDGGVASNSYLFSVGYDKNNTDLVGQYYDRLTLNLRNNIDLTKQIKLESDFYYAHEGGTQSGLGGYATGYRLGRDRVALFPYMRLVDESGNRLPVERDFRQSFVDTVGNGALLDWNYFPLQDRDAVQVTSAMNTLRFNIGAKAQLFSFLRASLKYQFGQSFGRNDDYMGPDSYYARNLINLMTTVKNGTPAYAVPMGGILDYSNSRLASHSFRMQTDLNLKIGDLGLLNGLIGAELRHSKQKSEGNRLYGYVDDLISSAPVNTIDYLPTYNGMYGLQRIPGGVSLSESTTRFISYYGNVGYSYDGRINFNASMRKDESNLFGVETNKRGVPLWSVGTSWNIAREDFWRSKIFSSLNLRATYGTSGNIPNGMSAYTIISNSSASSNSVVKIPYANIVSPRNPYLRWEKVAMANFALDFGLLDDRIKGTVEYYRKKVVDMVSSQTVDPTKGFSSVRVNSAHMTGQGVDLNLIGKVLKGSWNWTVNMQTGYAKNTLTKYLLNSQSPAYLYVGSGTNVLPYEGEMPYMLLSYRFNGLDPATGDPIGELDGAPSQNYKDIRQKTALDQLIFHGSPVPLWHGAMRNTLSYRQLELSANIAFKAAYYFRRNTISYSSLLKNNDGHADYALRWQKAGDELHTTVPSFVYPMNEDRDDFYSMSAATVENGSHIRLNDIRISYAFKGNLFGSKIIRGMDIYCFADRLNWVLWRKNRRGIDPEYPDGFKMPMQISFGLNMQL